MLFEILIFKGENLRMNLDITRIFVLPNLIEHNLITIIFLHWESKVSDGKIKCVKT